MQSSLSIIYIFPFTVRSCSTMSGQEVQSYFVPRAAELTQPVDSLGNDSSGGSWGEGTGNIYISPWGWAWRRGLGGPMVATLLSHILHDSICPTPELLISWFQTSPGGRV